MTGTSTGTATFHRGDHVELVTGTYQGTVGVFIEFKDDVNWADITEPNGAVRSHPVTWMGHTQSRLPVLQPVRESPAK